MHCRSRSGLPSAMAAPRWAPTNELKASRSRSRSRSRSPGPPDSSVEKGKPDKGCLLATATAATTAAATAATAATAPAQAPIKPSIVRLYMQTRWNPATTAEEDKKLLEELFEQTKAVASQRSDLPAILPAGLLSAIGQLDGFLFLAAQACKEVDERDKSTSPADAFQTWEARSGMHVHPYYAWICALVEDAISNSK